MTRPLPEPPGPIRQRLEDHLQHSLVAHGLRLCGQFRPQPDESLPLLVGDESPAVLWLVGVAGSAFWPVFSRSPEYEDQQPHALDRWSLRLGQALAARAGGRALFPFEGPPYWPFQQWAMRCEAVGPSMLGLLMHPDYGLWHAFRFALLLPAGVLAASQPQAMRPAVSGLLADQCLRCSGQPCLQACPVNSFSPGRYDVGACATWLTDEPQGACMTGGCRSRLACPEGTPWRYEEAHAAFHMRAFRDAH